MALSCPLQREIACMYLALHQLSWPSRATGLRSSIAFVHTGLGSQATIGIGAHRARSRSLLWLRAVLHFVRGSRDCQRPTFRKAVSADLRKFQQSQQKENECSDIFLGWFDVVACTTWPRCAGLQSSIEQDSGRCFANIIRYPVKSQYEGCACGTMRILKYSWTSRSVVKTSYIFEVVHSLNG